jgi:hypothetical protein
MDSASRGPMGAIQMVALWTGGSLAAAGGILTVLLVAFSPFLQQLLEYPLRDARTPSPDAWAPQNLAYNASFGESTANDDSRELVLPHAGLDTLRPLDSDAICPESRCSWPDVRSVGWCSKCGDATATAALNNCTIDAIVQDSVTNPSPCMLSLGVGDTLDVFGERRLKHPGTKYKEVVYGRDRIWRMSYGGRGYITQNFSDIPGGRGGIEVTAEQQRLLYGNDTDFLGVKNPLLVYGHALLDTNESPLEKGQSMLRVKEAEICILTLCERRYSVEKEGCATSWAETSRNYGNLFKTRQLCDELASRPGADEFGNADLACWQPGDNPSVLGRVGEECAFADTVERAFCPVQFYGDVLERHFPKEGPLMDLRRIEDTPDDLYNFSLNLYPTDDRYGKYLFNLTMEIELVENALTKNGLDQTTSRVTGYTIKPEAYVHVRWQWMLFPVALELAALTLFILVVVHSRREGVPIWKSSILAIIYHSVEELRNEKSPPTERLSDMQSAASATGVELWKSDGGLHRMARRPR